MKIAIWIIAICEVVRALQNMAQLMMVHRDTGARDNAYAEFVKSLKDTDEDFVENLLREFEREHGERKDEPQTDNGIGCSRCESRHWCYDRDKPNAKHCNNYGKITDEPQTESLPWWDAFDAMDCQSR